MSSWEYWRTRFGGSYWAWRIYHSVVADAVSIQRPTKFRIVHEFLGGSLGRAADIGCGPGVFTRYLCEHASEVCAADIDERALERVKGRHREKTNLGCVVTFADSLPFADGCLDTVLLLEVLEHLTDDACGITEAYRVLGYGGKLVLSVPVPPGEVHEADPRGHKREGYQLHEIQALLENHGFEVQDYHFAQFKFSRMGERWVQRWRLWFRLPAPILLGWVGYLDYLLNPEARTKGAFLPACVVLLARKNGNAPASKKNEMTRERHT